VVSGYLHCLLRHVSVAMLAQVHVVPTFPFGPAVPAVVEGVGSPVRASRSRRRDKPHGCIFFPILVFVGAMAVMLLHTQSEYEKFKTVDDIAEWADLPHRAEESANATSSPRGTFPKAFGATPSTKPRIIAAIPESTFQKIVEEWHIEDALPSLVLVASAGLMGAVGRAMHGVVSHAAAKENELEHIIELERIKAFAAPPPAAVKAGRSIKLSTLVDQASDLEVDAMPLPEVEAAYLTYKTKMGDMPRPEDDVIAEQLAVLRALFAIGAPPYVDLALWVPYGRHIHKNLKLTGLVMTASGTLQQAQLYGPPNLDESLAGLSMF
jgi:hypothetical protein